MDRNNDYDCDLPIRYEARVNTSDYYKTLNLPKRFECPYEFYGYGIQKKASNPFYMTTSSQYGYYTPNPHTVPHRFFPKTIKFSSHLAKCGMYRNYSLNTVMDKSFY